MSAFASNAELKQQADEFLQQRRYQEAADLFNSGIAAAPDWLEAYVGLSVAYLQAGMFEHAASVCEHGLLRCATQIDLLFNLGISYMRRRVWQTAESIMRSVLLYEVGHIAARYNLADSLRKQNRHEEAVEEFRKMLEYKPGDRQAQQGIKEGLLAAGRWKEALKAYRVWLSNPDSRNEPLPLAKLWKGESLNEKHIVIHSGGGLGDSIFHSRYFPLIGETAKRVTVLCRPELVSMYERHYSGCNFVPHNRVLQEYDCWATHEDLLCYFENGNHPCVTTSPYLAPLPRKVEQWAKYIDDRPEFKVGINWKGSPICGRDDQRSLPLSFFSTIKKIPYVSLYALQCQHGTYEMSWCTFPIVDLGTLWKRDSVEDAAGCIANMDLVIAIDSGVANLAGAIGVSTWVLLGHNYDCRWAADKESTPFYPSWKFFRQLVMGDWRDVLYRVSLAVQDQVKNCTKLKEQPCKT